MKQTKKVGRFHIMLKQLLGSGSFAKTYKAYRDKDKQKIYACKVINKEEMKSICEQTQYIVNRVQEQFKLLKKLKHENIVGFQDSQQTKNNLYLFFQFCDQGTLEKYIHDHKFEHDQKQELRITKQIINGCEYLTDMGIVHRDIKPQNILLKGNTIKIADFGLAKYLNEEDSYRSTLVGTFHYMAPQIIKEEKTKQTKKCDVWSVGITVFELINGYLPFEMNEKTQSPHGLLKKLESNKGQQLQIKNPLFKTLIERMLVLDSKKRISFTDAKKIISDFEQKQ